MNVPETVSIAVGFVSLVSVIVGTIQRAKGRRLVWGVGTRTEAIISVVVFLIALAVLTAIVLFLRPYWQQAQSGMDGH